MAIIYLLFTSIQDRTNQIWILLTLKGKCLKARNSDHRFIQGKSQSLAGDNSESQPGKGSGTDRYRESIYLGNFQPGLSKDNIDDIQQLPGVGPVVNRS